MTNQDKEKAIHIKWYIEDTNEYMDLLKNDCYNVNEANELLRKIDKWKIALEKAGVNVDRIDREEWELKTDRKRRKNNG